MDEDGVRITKWWTRGEAASARAVRDGSKLTLLKHKVKDNKGKTRMESGKTRVKRVSWKGEQS